MILWDAYKNIVKHLVNAGAVIACICICLMSVLVGVEVIGRAFFHTSTLIADEYAGYFSVGMVFFGAPYAFRLGSFINVDLVYSHFKGTFKKIIDIIILIFALTFLGIFIYYCIREVHQSYITHVTSLYISKTPIMIPQLAMPIGLGIFILEVISEFGGLIISGKGESI